jgi:hypothetical protein
MNETARQVLRRQAGFRCEYCRIHERHLPFSAFHLDHIVARQHGGTEVVENLAWSCQECNLLKGTNLSGIDPDTGLVVRLFHPREDRWEEHFCFLGDRVEGLTATGRATVSLLQMNSPGRLELRATLRAAGGV